jgi:anti-sigma factor RsiW
MNCRDWEERIALHAGGDLSAAEAQAVERHVADCAGCQMLLSGLRESLALVREAHSEPVEAAHFAAVRARVLSELERGAGRRWRFVWLYAMAAAAVVLLVVGWPRPELRMALPMPPAPGAPMVAKVQHRTPEARTARPRPRKAVAKAEAPQEPGEPMVVKLLTNDPDVVIYWITGTKGE